MAKKILLVDDDVITREIVKGMLAGTSWTVDEAADGEEASGKALSGIYDLVITDIVMPGKEGLELIMELKAARVAAKIVAISDGGGLGKPDSYLTSAGELGADALLAKPFDQKDLLALIDKLTRDGR